MSVGYHKILEIPEGATQINVTEMTKSRNYLGKQLSLSMYSLSLFHAQASPRFQASPSFLLLDTSGKALHVLSLGTQQVLEN